MADAYGTIIVCGDYKGNFKAIAKVLNSFCWNSDGDAKFCVYKDEDGSSVGLESYGVQYPTVFPLRDILVFDDGRKCFFDEADEPMVKEWEAGKGNSDYEHYSLEQLSDLISPLLVKGIIELVAVAHEKCRYAYYERLIIRSDGYAERHRHHAEIYSTTKPWSTYRV